MLETDTVAMITAVGESIGIPELRCDAQGCCRLLFDGAQLVELRHLRAQERWLLSCALRGAAPDISGLRRLLQGNFCGAGFGGGWAGLDPSGRAVLHLPLPQSQASAAALLAAVELLLSHSERWEKHLQENGAPRPRGAPREWA
jgi:hypothetical protein